MAKGFTVVVTDSSGRPRANYGVYVKWADGGSSMGRTNSSGEFDTGVQSYQRGSFIEVEGKHASGKFIFDSQNTFKDVEY